MDISDAGSDDAAFQLEESPSNNNIPESRELDLASPASSILNLDSSGDLELVETAIATFMTVSTWCGNDCAFLFWDADSGTFTRKCYAKFDSRSAKWKCQKPNQSYILIIITQFIA